MLVRMWRKETLVHYWWNCKLLQPILKTVWRFLKKLKNRTTIGSSNSTSAYLPKVNKNTNSKRYMHYYVHCSIIYNNQDMEAT